MQSWPILGWPQSSCQPTPRIIPKIHGTRIRPICSVSIGKGCKTPPQIAPSRREPERRSNKRRESGNTLGGFPNRARVCTWWGEARVTTWGHIAHRKEA